MKPILLIGEAQGEAEAKIGRGFVGASGAELLRMLRDAGVIKFASSDHEFMSRFYRTYDPWCLDAIWESHPEVRRTNVFQQHPPGNELRWFCGPKAEGLDGFAALAPSRYVRKEFAYELDRLGDEILLHDPNLLVCLGNSALWALCGFAGVTKLRGTTRVSTHTVAGYKLLSTYHPAAVMRQWELRPTVIADLSKINKEKEFPDVRRPPCEIWTEPTIEDIETFIAQHIKGCAMLSVDIETSGSQITCIGFAPRPDLALVVPIHDARVESGSYWGSAELERQCWRIVRSVLEDQSTPKLFQNGLYDVAFILRSTGIRVMGAREDTMLLHHALQPESLKRLGYLGSIYTDHGPWKAERGGTWTIKRDE